MPGDGVDRFRVRQLIRHLTRGVSEQRHQGKEGHRRQLRLDGAGCEQPPSIGMEHGQDQGDGPIQGEVEDRKREAVQALPGDDADQEPERWEEK